MANIYEYFPSRFLSTADLQGEPVVTIARVEFEAMGHGRKRETKPIVYFVGHVKGLKLNKTMATALVAIAGSPMTDAWLGVTVCLFAASATFGADTFAVVRVKAPAVAARPIAPAPAAPPRTHPSGYLAWLDTMRAAAMHGQPALEQAWFDAPLDLRQYLVTAAPGAMAEFRAIASRMVTTEGSRPS